MNKDGKQMIAGSSVAAGVCFGFASVIPSPFAVYMVMAGCGSLFVTIATIDQIYLAPARQNKRQSVLEMYGLCQPHREEEMITQRYQTESIAQVAKPRPELPLPRPEPLIVKPSPGIAIDDWPTRKTIEMRNDGIR